MLACIVHPVTVPNPYLLQQWSVVGILIVVFAFWVQIRPPAVWVLRLPAMLAALVATVAMFATVLGVYDSPEPECRLALEASLLLPGCLGAELFSVWRRERTGLARAFALARSPGPRRGRNDHFGGSASWR